MSSSDFVIENGVLKKYTGSDESVTVPDGVKEIGFLAFEKCENLKSVTLPVSVKKISRNVFYGCKNIETLKILGSSVKFDVIAFGSKLKRIEAPMSVIETLHEDFFTEFPYDNDMNAKEVSDIEYYWDAYFLSLVVDIVATDKKIGARVPIISKSASDPGHKETLFGNDIKKYDSMLNSANYLKSSDLLAGMMWRLAFPAELDERSKEIYRQTISGKAKAAAKLAFASDNADWLRALLDEEIINDSNSKAILKLANDFDCPLCKALLDERKDSEPVPAKKDAETEKSKPEKEKEPDSAEESINPIEEFCKENFDWAVIKKTLLSVKIIYSDLENVRYKDSGSVAPADVVACAIGPYIMRYTGLPRQIGGYKTDAESYAIIPNADKVAASLNAIDLQKVLDVLAEQFFDYPALMIPYGRFCSGKQFTHLTSLMKKWSDWYSFSSKGRSLIIVARGALLLSDTKEAIAYFEKIKNKYRDPLYEYARLRGMTPDELRDSVMMDFGLDSDGKKKYDLGSTVIEASISNDLSVSLYDCNANKIVKSLPKKGADLQKYEACNADYSDLKKNLKKAVRLKNLQLMKDYLYASKIEASSWQSLYLGNPVLRSIACLLVWTQDKKTSFTVGDSGLIDSNGSEYIMTDKPVYIAHNMEMDAEQISAWQKYFVSKGKKQPFEQVWEPVINFKKVDKNRYTGAEIPLFRFNDQEKHGVTLIKDAEYNPYGNKYVYTKLDIRLSDCSIKWHMKEGYISDANMQSLITVDSFDYAKESRQSNHIIYYLDKCTVYSRIAVDNDSVLDNLDGYTVAQIDSFLKFAIENNATKCTAGLLNYKNEHFADFTDVDEFTLDF